MGTIEEGCATTRETDVFRSLKRRLLTGSAWAFAGKLITAFSGLAVSALLARLLSPEAMGVYFLVFSLAAVSAMVAQLGMNQAVVKLVAESLGTGKPGRAARAIRLVFRNGTLGAIAVAMVVAFGGGKWLAMQAFHSPVMTTVMGLAALWIVVLTFQGLLAESFRGFHDIRLATIFGGLVTSVLSAALFGGLWVLQGHCELREVIALSVVAGATSALVAGIILRRRLGTLQGEGDLGQKELSRISRPQWATNLTYFLLTQAALWILGFFRPQGEVALYGAAFRLVTLVAVPLVIVNAVVPPIIAELYAQGRKGRLGESPAVDGDLVRYPLISGFALFCRLWRPDPFPGFWQFLPGREFDPGFFEPWPDGRR